MIKVVNTIGAYHDGEVQEVVDTLQSNGYDVKRIERIKKGWIFGNDVTNIHYTDPLEERYHHD